jgi:osmotically-inducible protein OsmY
MPHARRKIGLTLLVGVVGLYTTGEARAQSNSLFGGTGAMSGSAGMGLAAPAGNTAGFGAGSSNSAFPQSTFPSSGTMGAGSTGMGMGATGMGQGMGMTGAQGAGGAAGQAGRFVGQTNNRFVGMAAAGQQQPQNQNRNNQNRNNANRNQAQNQNQNQAGAGANSQRAIRPRLTVNFDYPLPTVQKTTTVLSKRFEKLSKRAAFKGVTLEADGGLVTLRGEVDTPETSRLAAMLTRLEPGVRTVQNELTVARAPAPESADHQPETTTPSSE